MLLDYRLDLMSVVARLLIFFDLVGRRARQLVGLTTQQTLQGKVTIEHRGDLGELFFFLTEDNRNTEVCQYHV